MNQLPFDEEKLPLDSYRPGYPSFAALLNVDPAFQNFRRFSRARLRLLLLQQDQISDLEANLDRIDTEEPRQLFLSCARRDENPERQELLERLRNSLSDYDTMMRNYKNTFQLPNADHRDVNSIRNWIEGTGGIAREESKYIEQEEDLLNLRGKPDGAVGYIETIVGEIALKLAVHLRKRVKFLPESMKPGRCNLTHDQNVFVMGPRLHTFSRLVSCWIVSAILLTPVVALFCIRDPVGRLVTIVFSAVMFLSSLSIWTKARTIEIVTVGASYAAVLVVFTSASNYTNS